MVIAYRPRVADTAVDDANPLPVTEALEAPTRRSTRTGAGTSEDVFGNLRVDTDVRPRSRSDALTGGASGGQPTTSNQHFKLRGHWRGRVVDVGNETFRAVLEDMRGNLPERLADIYVDEVAPADRQLLRDGATFYWSIGYVDTLGGQRTRQSEVRFQRRPSWTVDDRREAEGWAARMKRLVERGSVERA